MKLLWIVIVAVGIAWGVGSFVQGELAQAARVLGTVVEGR